MTASRLDQLLAVLAEPTRRAIVDMLKVSPARAGEIHAAFPIADTAISRHLRVLREAGVVVQRPVAGDARVRRYELVPASLAELADWIQGLTEAVAGLQSADADAGQPEQAQLDAFREYVAVRSSALKRASS